LGLEGAQLLVLARPAQLLGGELQLGERLVERVLGDELLLEELLRAVGLLLRDVDARLRRLELPGRLGARAGESERGALGARRQLDQHLAALHVVAALDRHRLDDRGQVDRKSTRLNSSHVKISYAGFCLEKKIYSSSSELPERTHDK